jgi:hypothetical protein
MLMAGAGNLMLSITIKLKLAMILIHLSNSKLWTAGYNWFVGVRGSRSFTVDIRLFSSFVTRIVSRSSCRSFKGGVKLLLNLCQMEFIFYVVLICWIGCAG